MFRYIMPIILIGIAGTGLFVFTKPIIDDISKIDTKIASYNEALSNSKNLEEERDRLTKKYNSINQEDLARLQKLLPDNVDNIRLVLEVERIALSNGSMALKDVKYDTTKLDSIGSLTASTTGSTANTGAPAATNNLIKRDPVKEYGTWNLEFSTEGTYSNFLSFVKDLESNLRIVDISSIAFSSDSNVVLGKSKPTDVYKYNFKIKTYWLKN